MYEFLFRQQDLEDGLPPAVSFTFLGDEETRVFDLLGSALVNREKLQKEVSSAHSVCVNLGCEIWGQDAALRDPLVHQSECFLVSTPSLTP